MKCIKTAINIKSTKYLLTIKIISVTINVNQLIRRVKMFNFLVTTDINKLNDLGQVIMLDGTVPDWKPKSSRSYMSSDIHFDHHRPGGADIQIDEMISTDFQEIVEPSATFVTTMVDADACVAAAFIVLCHMGEIPNSKTFKKLRAIAYDCDHLAVPESLSHLADFAAQAVAAMKANSNETINILSLPKDRTKWTVEDKELFSSECFKLGTHHLVNACLGLCPFPGEQGEAKSYWKNVEKVTQKILDENRIRFYKGCAIFDGTEISEYVDPRCWLKAMKQYGDITYPVTLTRRTVVNGGVHQGYCYTLGTIPLHPDQASWDYTSSIFDALTKAELINYGNESKWGGRRTVGGSGLKQISMLSPYEIIDICLDHKPDV